MEDNKEPHLDELLNELLFRIKRLKATAQAHIDARNNKKPADNQEHPRGENEKSV